MESKRFAVTVTQKYTLITANMEEAFKNNFTYVIRGTFFAPDPATGELAWRYLEIQPESIAIQAQEIFYSADDPSTPLPF